MGAGGGGDGVIVLGNIFYFRRKNSECTSQTNDTMEQEFTLKTGRRTYFFDLVESKQGGTYLDITESKRMADGYRRSNIIISEEHIDDFIDQLEKVKACVKVETDEKSYSIDKIREKYPNAYNKWDEEQDEELTRLYCEGHKVSKIAKIMKRQPGGIRSRVRKLELKEMYGEK